MSNLVGFLPEMYSRLKGYNKSSSLIDHVSDDFSDFYNDFQRHLDELAEALKKSKKVKKTADDLKNKGYFKNVVDGLSGANDKSLAEMMGSLGESVEVTQTILQLMMKSLNVKNVYLKDFNDALVNKISLLQQDTVTLDENQRSVTIAVLSEIRSQVQDQLDQRDLIQNHQERLTEIDVYVDLKNETDLRQDQMIMEIESTARELIEKDSERAILIEKLHAAHANKDELDRVQTQRIDDLVVSVASIDISIKNISRRLDLLEANMAIFDSGFSEFVRERKNERGLRLLLINAAPSVLAICVAVSSLAVALGWLK